MPKRSRNEIATKVSGDEIRLPSDDVRLTERVSVGRTRREWHLPFEAKLSSSRSPAGQRYIEVPFLLEASVVQSTCEFLRKHAPREYAQLWKGLQAALPVNPKRPESVRVAREGVKPDSSRSEQDSERGVRREVPLHAPFSPRVPTLDKEHWAYKRHQHVGNYCSHLSGDPVILAKEEAEQDVQSILYYLEKYRTLATEVTGKNLWAATKEPNFRDPYYTCMELCVGEAQIPSHFLSFVHYGIGLQMMYEVSLPWKTKGATSHPQLLEPFKDSFRAVARLYREDFC